MISGISKIVVPVGDQARAKEFWTSRLGFDVVSDESYGDERWIEVSPASGAPVLMLSPRRETELFFTCADIESTHRELTRRGVRFPVPPARMHFGWWSLFEDDEGTCYALGQWD